MGDLVGETEKKLKWEEHKREIDMEWLVSLYDLGKLGYILVPFSLVNPNQRIILGKDPHKTIILGVVDKDQEISKYFSLAIKKGKMPFYGYMQEKGKEEVLYIFNNDGKSKEEEVYGGNLPIGAFELNFESLSQILRKSDCGNCPIQ